MAVIALGISLVAASWSVAPKWEEVSREEMESLRDAVADQFRSRRRSLAVSTWFFAIALLLACLSPFISLLLPAPAPIIHYSIDEKGVLEAGLEAEGLPSGATIELRLEGAASVVTKSATTADGRGKARVVLKMAAAASIAGSMTLVGCVGISEQAPCVTSLQLTVAK